MESKVKPFCSSGHLFKCFKVILQLRFKCSHMSSTVRGRSEETLYESLSYQELHQRSSKGWKEQVGIVMMTLLTMMLVLIISNNIFSVQMLFVCLGLI